MSIISGQIHGLNEKKLKKKLSRQRQKHIKLERYNIIYQKNIQHVIRNGSYVGEAFF